MAVQGFSFWERRSLTRALKRWAEIAEGAERIPPAELRALQGRLAGMRHKLDNARIAADAALLAAAPGNHEIERPEQCDWAFRPALWRAPIAPFGAVAVPSPTDLGGGVKLFHDAKQSELSYRQVRNTRRDIPSPYGLMLDVYRFDGSFLSLAQDMPSDAVVGLTRGHYLTVSLRTALESPLEIYARLNVQHGPNCEQIVRQFDFDGDKAVAEFDLAYSKINEKRLEKMWLDLIFEGPQMNQATLWDMTLVRAPRADL